MIQTYAQAYERLRSLTGKVADLPRWEELTETERHVFSFHSSMHIAFEEIARARGVA